MEVSTITIVGGGTSAWLAAAYLYKNNPGIHVTIIDKEVGTPIGVGEATLLSFKPFMEECGFPTEEWLVPLDAGFKSGIMFTNWREKGDTIWHPFSSGNKIVSGTDLRVWDLWSQNQNFNFKQYATGLYEASVLHNTIDIDNSTAYAFHVDCGKLVVYIQERIQDKITVIRSDVVNVVKNELGSISSLELKNGNTHNSDLYIDCTGFKQILKVSSQRINLEDRLFVNTAVVCQVPYADRPNEFKPYATCDATDHGWLWKIGVASRIGSGMIFNRNITDIEEAKDYFVNYWDNRIKKENVRVIHWDPFYMEDQWAGNVINIGLSAGFIEPLESTGIGLITAGITRLHNAIQERYYSQVDQDYFNNQMKTLFEDCADFVSMHYTNNKRTSKFWSWVTKKFVPSKRMLHFISELNNSNISVPHKGKHNYMFTGHNWALLLQQLGYLTAPRNTGIPDPVAAELLVRHYIEVEKHRHTWSRHHSTEIDRIVELRKL